MANSVFFEAESFRTSQPPYRHGTGLDPLLSQLGHQHLDRQVELRFQPANNQISVRLQQALAVIAPIGREAAVPSLGGAATISPRSPRSHRIATPLPGNCDSTKPPPQPARANHSNTVSPSLPTSIPSQQVESETIPDGNPPFDSVNLQPSLVPFRARLQLVDDVVHIEMSTLFDDLAVGDPQHHEEREAKLLPFGRNAVPFGTEFSFED